MMPEVRTRILNRDSVDLIVSRLTQTRMRSLRRWISSSDATHRLSTEAPLVDAILIACSRSIQPEDFLTDGPCPTPFNPIREMSSTAFLFGLETGLAMTRSWDIDDETSVSLEDALQVLSHHRIDPDEFRQPKDSCAATSTGLFDELVALQPACEVIVAAVWALGAVRRPVFKGAAAPVRRNRSAAIRFTFFAGLVAAGLTIPDCNSEPHESAEEQ